MKKTIVVLIVLFSANAQALKYSVEGTVHTLRHNVNAENGDFIMLNGVAEAGSCPTGSAGLVLVRIPDSADRAYSTALAAQVAGKKVELSVDDEVAGLGGYCRLRWLGIAD